MNEICGNVRKFTPKFEIEYSMKRIFQVFFSMLVVALAFTSCLKSDNDTVTLYDDIAIMEFKLGTLNRYLHTTSSIHTDSIYKVTYSASNYVMNIDQINHKIYNTDSLLVGTDISRVVCTVTTENSGVVYVKSQTSDSLTYLRSDSIDFTEPRIFRVYASDGSCSRDYTVSLNVRTVEKGTFYWTETSKELFPTTDVEQPNWAEELMDSTDADMVPYAVLGYIRWNINSKTDYSLMVGKSNALKGMLVVWRKIIDDNRTSQWTYMPWAEDNSDYLPDMDRLELVYFKNSVLAFGSDGKIYQSRDQGVTWKTGNTFVYPEGFDVASPFQIAVDADGCLWLTDTVNGRTWKGVMTD